MLNRRSVLASIPACGLAAIVPASAVAIELEHPWVKVRRLARELSETLAECDGGACYAEVFPTGGKHMPFVFGSIDALPSMMLPLERAKHHVEQTRLAMEEHSGVKWRKDVDPSHGFALVAQRYD